MKWLGGLAGLLVGFSVGRFEAAAGWMLGGFLAGGALDFFRQPRNAAPVKDGESESARVFKALGEIHWRLKRLEAQASLPAARAGAAVTHNPAAVESGFADRVEPRKLGLWAMLLGAVLILALMAWRLAGRINKGG